MASSGGDAPTGTPQSPPSGSRGDRRGGRGGNASPWNRGRGGGSNNGQSGSSSRSGASGNNNTGRGRGGRGRGRGAPRPGPQTDGVERGSAADSVPAPAPLPADSAKANAAAVEDPEAEVCFICANPIAHYSIAPCNHTTCHICGLRMRALYKTKECPHCRTPSDYVIFTDDATKHFEDYTPSDITSSHDDIGIRFANEEIVGDTVLLLRYNCPDPTCDFAGLGWPGLHRHVRSEHHKKMCDLCTRNKKVFTHEHDLFTDKELDRHIRHGDDKPGALDQTGFKGHPMCGFCNLRFYDDDKLYEHCRQRHERCFLCDRSERREQAYFLDYAHLEKHFRESHFPCLDAECLEKKFVVFGSELDLKAHQLSEHGNSLSKDVRRDARVVDISGFDYRQTYQQERRGGPSSGGGRDGRGGSRGSGRGRDPNAEPLPVSSAQPLRRDELAFQRQLAIQSAQSVSNRAFGGQVSTPSGSSTPRTTASRPNGAAPPSTAAPSQPPAQLLDAMESLSMQDAASMSPQDRARLVRHGAVIERAANLLGNDASKMTTFREYISSFRQDQLSAPQFVDALFAIFSEASSSALGTLIRELADLFENPAKASALLAAWNDERSNNEDYPSLPGLGGMHGATTASSGWATAAAASPTTPQAAAPSQKHSTRVLRLKNSTRRGSASSQGSSTGSAPAPTWLTGSSSSSARPNTTSRSLPSSAFPALGGPSAPSGSTARPTWIGAATASSTSGSRPAASRSAASGGASREEAFPALPAAPKPMTTILGYGRGILRRDLDPARPTGFSWGNQGGSGSAAGSGANSGVASEVDEEAAAEGAGRKKKGNKGKKEILAHWG